MPAAQIDSLLTIWAASLLQHGGEPLFASHQDLYKTIDSTPLGDVKWESFSVKYTGEQPAAGPPWMNDNYEVWFRDPCQLVHSILGNPEFANETDFRAYREFETATDKRQFHDFMSADWAWEQSDLIAEDVGTHGSTFVPIILGSDKTMVSVATGQNDFYPLYLSVGNVRNNVRRAHRNALVLVGFLAMPKTTQEHASNVEFRLFKRQLFHTSLLGILESLKPGMTTPEVVRFGDGHYRRVIYGLGPYIADYKEQVLLSCIVRNWCPKCLSRRDNLDADSLARCQEHTEELIKDFEFEDLWDQYGIVKQLVSDTGSEWCSTQPFTNDFPRADIYKLLSPDLLHQIIKGAFKDHLVDWVERYLNKVHGTSRAKIIFDDIDRRYVFRQSSQLCKWPDQCQPLL
ncbi:hypothetical protein L210DRAFT_3502465 [Boletus edulis BED1]|uniref:Uncharacterized protein n=1 Tax=Boletus edulis BED1 TaxID=1328754 RepID=A0AAD4GGV5_BOLED|nr:hypothetical protein L210DRAFT_3502465 [Boletus edulis BED1]